MRAKIIEMAGLAEGSSRESVLSLQEVIEEDKELEQMANAVLGASDDKKCTYPQVTTIIIRNKRACYQNCTLYSVGVREAAGAVRVCIV